MQQPVLLLAILAAAVVAGVAALSVLRGAAPPQCRSALIPAYLRPEGLARIAERPVHRRVVIFNPSSGPHSERQPSYERAVAALQRSGTSVLGYVHTTYGLRDAAAVEADISRYQSWYGVDGVFLDEAAATASRLSYYHELSHHARAVGARFIVLNPGVMPAREYFGIADAIVTFEGPISAYRDRRNADGIAPERTVHLIYGASREQALRALEPSPSAGYMYVTSGTLPHPWGTVPDYFAQELAALGDCQ
jgi:hypothetical protein